MRAALHLLLPALIPSWRFFEAVQPSPRVEWRYCGQTDWIAFQPRPARVSIWQLARHLFYNPNWNESLYAVSLAERLTVEPTTHAEDALFQLIARGVSDHRSEPLEFRLLFVTRETSEVTYHSAPRLLTECAS